MKWTHDSIPDQTGRVAIVTGANTGLGLATARALAEKGARVILACRSEVKGEAAVDRLHDDDATLDLHVRRLDLADLDQVRTFADRFRAEHDRLDLLINNAGVMACPHGTTAQGFEMQLGVNHLGHFALTGHLLGLLARTPGSRVVNVSSIAHKQGRMDLEDLLFERREYKPWTAYGQSKLANLLFTSELQRRMEQSGLAVQAVAAHPGWTTTDLQRHSPTARWLSPFFGMRPRKGSLPTLRAATDPQAEGNDYYGPRGLLEMSGYPKVVGRSERARREEDAARLWDLSETLTGVAYLGRAEAA